MSKAVGARFCTRCGDVLDNKRSRTRFSIKIYRNYRLNAGNPTLAQKEDFCHNCTEEYLLWFLGTRAMYDEWGEKLLSAKRREYRDEYLQKLEPVELPKEFKGDQDETM